ncbi:MAG: lipopolysaccharide biosynthesis protein [Thermoguttaceae bacterium]|jgi:O-antigen/teichoic acid export membrane protein
MKKPIARLLQGAGLSCGSLVVRIAFGLFLTPYMLSVVGDKAFGVFALSSLFAGWCGLLDFGLTTTTSRYITKYYTNDDWDGTNEIGSTAIILFSGIATLIFLLACLAFFATKLLGDAFDETGLLAAALFFAGTSFAISKISDGYCGVIKGAMRQEYTGATSLVTRIVIGFTNFAVLALGGRVLAILAANCIITGLQLVAYMILTRKVVPRFHFSIKSFRAKRVRTLFSYGVFAFLAQAGEIAVTRSDLIIIAALASMEDVTKYNLVVIVLTSYFNSFLTEGSSWETNWFAHLAAHETTEDEFDRETPTQGLGVRGLLRRAVGRADVAPFSPKFYASRATITRASIYLTIFGAMGILFLGRFFIERWIGAEYLVAFPALIASMAAQGLYRGSAEVNSRLLQGVARHQVLAVAAILHGVLNIVLSVVFLKMGLGLLGVALGTVVPGFAIYFLWLPNATCRLVGERRSVYWRRQFRATLIGVAAAALPAYLILTWGAPNYLSIVALGTLSAALYFPVVITFGLTRDERRKLRELATRYLLRRSA